MAFRTGNPMLNDNTFDNIESTFGRETMSIVGTVNKTLMLLALVLIGAGWTWFLFAANSPSLFGWAIGGVIGGLILAIITVFRPNLAAFTAPPYAICEGLFLGAISAIIAARYPQVAIVPQAVGLTLGTLLVMLVAYGTGLIRPTEKFTAGLVAATGAIGLVYLVSIGMSFFGMQMPYIHGAGPIGIGFSVVVVIIAALNLVLDFEFVQQGVQQNAPKHMEWYAAFGLLVTLVWLYLEILRLLSKLNSKR